MQETLEYIEAYFTQTLSPEERKDFEKRCEADATFAREVAFYLTARSAAREVLMEEKQKSFAERTMPQQVTVKTASVKKMVLRKWISYAAAACIILFVGSYFLLTTPAPQQLAGRYIKENYTILHVPMDASRDSMQLGIAAYNNKNYQQAIALFDGVRSSHPEKNEVKKFAGLAYLQTKNYDKALECFQELTAMKGRYNSGDILQAVTLLQRNGTSDKENAKLILERIVKKNEEGSDEAKALLKKL